MDSHLINSGNLKIKIPKQVEIIKFRFDTPKAYLYIDIHASLIILLCLQTDMKKELNNEKQNIMDGYRRKAYTGTWRNDTAA